MSHKLFANDVLFLQRFLASLGLYADELDGDWGPNTDKAYGAFAAQSDEIAAAEGALDPRSETNIRTLHPRLQTLGRRMIRLLVAKGTDARIISGTRSYTEQDALYRQGRYGNPGAIVTKARGGQSNHNFCIAFDIGIFRAGKYLANETGPYRAAAAATQADVVGLGWGGDWTIHKDYPHWELPTGLAIAEVRARFEKGENYVT